MSSDLIVCNSWIRLAHQRAPSKCEEREIVWRYCYYVFYWLTSRYLSVKLCVDDSKNINNDVNVVDTLAFCVCYPCVHCSLMSDLFLAIRRFKQRRSSSSSSSKHTFCLLQISFPINELCTHMFHQSKTDLRRGKLRCRFGVCVCAALVSPTK